MKTLLLLLLLFCSTAHAGNLAITCDSKAAGKGDCLKWAQGIVQSLGCRSTSSQCVLHNWGSDFVKSWICTLETPDCEPAKYGNCEPGLTHVFHDRVWEACRKFKTPPKTFFGQCEHQNADRGVELSECDDQVSPCTPLGGHRTTITAGCRQKSLLGDLKLFTRSKCTEVESECANTSGSIEGKWKIQCRFSPIQVQYKASSCEELKTRCERGNSTSGANGSLIGCVAN